MLLRFLHVSDTHVGFSAYHRVTAEGTNERERDFFEAFRRVVDLALAERVDAVLHSGDLFDSVRPTNRAVSFAMEEVRRLARGGIPFLAIAGNHETPKLRETGSVFRFLEFIDGAHPVYKGAYEIIQLGDVAFHCVPHASSQEALAENLERAEPVPDAKWNVLTFHAGILGVADFRSGEFNEHVVPASLVKPSFDYVALGHYHRATRVTENAYYAGSTERCSFKEEREEKSVNLVDLRAKRVETRRLATRPMRTLGTVECRGRPDLEVPVSVYKAIQEAELEGAIARLRVEGIAPHVYATLEFDRIRRLSAAALHFQVEWDVARDGATGAGAPTGIGALAAEFDGFLAGVPVEGLSRARLLEKGLGFLEAAQSARGSGPG